MKLSKKILSLFLILTILFTLAGCSSVNILKQDENATKVFKTTDNKVEVTVPVSWKKTNLNNEVASLQLASLVNEQYFMIITEDATDFVDATSEDYLNAIKENMKLIGTEFKESNHKSLTINGNKASQCEVYAIVNKIKIKYLVTAIKSKNQFIQVLAWSLASKYEKNKDVFIKATNTIKVTE